MATDEPQVLTELNLRFPQIKWLSNGLDGSESSVLQNRYRVVEYSLEKNIPYHLEKKNSKRIQAK